MSSEVGAGREGEREREGVFFSIFCFFVFVCPQLSFFFVKDFPIFFRFFHPQTESAYYKTEQNAPFFFFLSRCLSLSFSLHQVVPPAAAVRGLLGPRGRAAGRAGVECRAEAEEYAVRQAAVLYKEAVGVDGDVRGALVEVVWDGWWWCLIRSFSV